MLVILADSLGIYFNTKADKYIKLMFDNANTGYAEVRALDVISIYVSSDSINRREHISAKTLPSL